MTPGDRDIVRVEPTGDRDAALEPTSAKPYRIWRDNSGIVHQSVEPNTRCTIQVVQALQADLKAAAESVPYLLLVHMGVMSLDREARIYVEGQVSDARRVALRWIAAACTRCCELLYVSPPQA